ncbi:unnamed protein product [Boreogadus saida]
MILLLFSPAGVRAVCAGEHSGPPAEKVPGQRCGFAPAGLPSLQQPAWEAKAGAGRVISLLEAQTLQNGVQSSSREAGESQTDSCPTPDMTLPFPTVAPCSDSPRAQSRNTPLADGIIIASKRADSRGPSPGSGGPCVIACETDRRVSVGELVHLFKSHDQTHANQGFVSSAYLRIRAPRLELRRTLPLSVSNGADTSLAAVSVCKKSKGGREKDEEQVEEEVSRAHEEEVKVEEEEEEEEEEGEPGVIVTREAAATAGPPAGRSLRAVGRETGAAVLAGRLGFSGRWWWCGGE